MGSSQHAPLSSRRCVESDPGVGRERPKGKEKSASISSLRRRSGIGKGCSGLASRMRSLASAREWRGRAADRANATQDCPPGAERSDALAPMAPEAER